MIGFNDIPRLQEAQVVAPVLLWYWPDEQLMQAVPIDWPVAE
jgi:hypothetical protein